jgi:glycosyltransferase involved in cell wall biosynthesis
MNSSAPLVLAVPVFNAEAYLPATLESLNAQGSAVRWWLQDGGSTDRTAEIARSYARPEDTVVSEKDAGQTDALNRAFHKMGGSIVGFLNGDDVLAPATAERVTRYFDDHPEIDLIYGSVEWIDENGKITGTHRGRIDSLSAMLDIYHVWWRERQWVQPEVFFRRSLFERVGDFDTRWHLAFDYDFWVRCFSAGARVAHVPGVIAQFRRHHAQKSIAAEKAATEIRAIVQRHLPTAPIGSWQKRRIEAALAYDEYQLGRSTPSGSRPSFSTALLTHPHWLLATAVRRRIQSSLANLLPFRRRRSQ